VETHKLIFEKISKVFEILKIYDCIYSKYNRYRLCW